MTHDLEIEYELICEHEDEHPRHCFATGDDALDAQLVSDIIARHDAGDPWAWFCAHVVARVTIDGETFEGHDYLGACSYESEADFRACPYFESMKHEARTALKVALLAAQTRGTLAHDALRGWQED